MLQTILYNPVYAGFHVMGKRKVSLNRGIKQHDVEREKWLFFPDYHEAYITMEEYEEIRRTMNKNKAAFEKVQKDAVEKRKELPDYFPEKVMCADCNRKMVFVRGAHQRGKDGQTFGYYRCRSRKKDGSCRNRHVQGELLQIRVMDEICKLTGENDKKDFSPELADELVEKIWVHENGIRIDVDFYQSEQQRWNI